VSGFCVTDVSVVPFDKRNSLLVLNLKIRQDWEFDRMNVFIFLTIGTLLTLVDICQNARESMPVYQMVQRFFNWIDESEETRSVLELGSRARSGSTNRAHFSKKHRYTGVDFMDGENVDIVADAHSLSDHFKPDSIDAIFAISVFEHLAIPWKTAIEINHIMRVRGRAMF